MNIPEAKEIQYATKLYDNTLPIASIVQNNIINQDNLMHININNVHEYELKIMIDFLEFSLSLFLHLCKYCGSQLPIEFLLNFI